VAYTQVQPRAIPATNVPTAPQPAPQSVTDPLLPQPVLQQPTPRPEVPLAEKSIDQLLDRLEALRAQKAELEKAEQELVKEIRRKMEKQSDRINRLGITPNDPPPVIGSSSSLAPPPGIPTSPVPARVP
jgi:hypothetical protein